MAYNLSTLVAECDDTLSEGESLECWQADRLPAGTYTFSAVAGTGCDGDLGIECSPCEIDDNGECSVSDRFSIGGQILNAGATFNFVPSAGSAPGGDSSGALPPEELRIVRLVFTDE